MTSRLTTKQAKYLAFISQYTALHGRAPAETEMQRYFRVTPPSVHRMVLALEERGAISRVPGQARSIRVLVPPAEVPPLDARAPASSAPALQGGAGTSAAKPAPPDGDAGPSVDAVDVILHAAGRAIARMFERMDLHPIDDAELAPLIRCVALGAEEAMLGAGIPARDAAAAAGRILSFAVKLHVQRCAEHDPDEADAKEDAQTFRRLMAGGERPGGRTGQGALRRVPRSAGG